MLLVEPLPPAAAGDTATMCALADLVNKVYAESETGLWLDGAARTSTEELAGITRAGQLVVARLDGRIVGCVRVARLDDEQSEFAMLAASPEHRGTGIGRALVLHAERQSLAEGRHVMRLELLVPREWKHPSKERLAQWYDRLGYRLVRVGTLDEDYPHLAPLLATPCAYRIYHKDLRTRGGRES
jgi:GNAT superfamily N-acetyltransferase